MRSIKMKLDNNIVFLLQKCETLDAKVYYLTIISMLLFCLQSENIQSVKAIKNHI